MPKVVIYSDLDGTLLDYDSYSFKASAEALDLIRSKNIPLILCTSKTRKEIELYRKQIEDEYDEDLYHAYGVEEYWQEVRQELSLL